MTILLSSLGGGGGLPQLAPDLSFPANINANDGAITVTNIDGSSGLTTALSLSGKWSIGLLRFQSLTSESITIKLTVDGVVIWNTALTPPSSNLVLLGNTSTSSTREFFQCESSLLLEIQTTTDSNCQLAYVARPIL